MLCLLLRPMPTSGVRLRVSERLSDVSLLSLLAPAGSGPSTAPAVGVAKLCHWSPYAATQIVHVLRSINSAPYSRQGMPLSSPHCTLSGTPVRVISSSAVRAVMPSSAKS